MAEFGIDFRPIRPDWDPSDPKLIRLCEDLKRGPELLYRKMLLPESKGPYQDLLSVATDADFMIAGELVYAAPLVAEKLRMRWASVILSPFSFFSCFDPSMMANVPSLIHLRKLGSSAYRLGLSIGRLATRHWSDPVRDLPPFRRPATGMRPGIQGQVFFRSCAGALFTTSCPATARLSSQTVQAGFVYFDHQAPETCPLPELSSFLASGDAPVVFTQGSTAVHNPGNFYGVSAAAAERLGRRAILIGATANSKFNSPDLLTLPYIAYSQVFPYAAVNIHQGGSGTTGEALRAGRPMLVLPYGWDQPDNAAHVQRLGVGLHVARDAYTVETAASALMQLMRNARFASRAAAIRTRLVTEDGLARACTAIESIL